MAIDAMMGRPTYDVVLADKSESASQADERRSRASRRYDVVLADPPWDYYGSTTKMAAAGKHYPLMPDQDLLDFGLGDWLAPKGVAFIWATAPRLD